MRALWATVAALLTAARLAMLCLAPSASMLTPPSGNIADCVVMKALKREFLLKIIAGGGAAVGESPPGLEKKLSAGEIEGLADYVATHFCGHD